MLSYGRHIVFLMESRIPLRADKGNKSGDSSAMKKPTTTAGMTGSSAIRLKGQMKWISSWNMIVFLCHPMSVRSSASFFSPSRLVACRLSTTEEMMDIGLTLHDLNFYDGSSEILIAGMQHARQLQAAIDKVVAREWNAEHAFD